MKYIVLEHLSGSRKKDVEEFPLGQYSELLVGRDPSANVRFAPDETLVGRQHLRLSPDPTDPTRFLITDLKSRNGTFINGHRVIGTTIIKPGDIVQCGPNGPEFRFDLRPATEPIASAPPPTEFGGVSGPAADPTAAGFPLAHLANAGAPPPPSNVAPEPPKGPIPSPPPAEPQVQVYAPSAPRSGTPWLIAAGAVVAMVLVAAGVIAYRSLTATSATAPPVAVSSPQPGSTVEETGASNVAANTAAVDAEKDPERFAWQLNIGPYLTLGAGRPGKGASDFDKPDGVAFSAKGLLFATDSGNRRVQVWDVKTGTHLGEFGHGVLGADIGNIAVAPDETVFITDQKLNLAYTFVPPQPGEMDEKGTPLSPYDYRYKGSRFGEQQFGKLGGIAIDSRGRIYVADAQANNVRRFHPDTTRDDTFKFEQKRPDGDTYLHGCEGLAIDETSGNLYVGSEKDSLIAVFDAETGAFRRKLVGAGLDATGKLTGKNVFFGLVEGLALTRRHLMAVDENSGHIQVFDLDHPDTFNRDLTQQGTPRPKRPSGYRGYFGHSPLVNFDDTTNIEVQGQVQSGAIVPGQANPPGHFCSPDAIAAHTDSSTGETYIAIADQCNYRLAVYRWSDLAKALGEPMTVAAAPIAVSKPANPAPKRPSRTMSFRRRGPRAVVVTKKDAERRAKEAEKRAEENAKKKKKKKY